MSPLVARIRPADLRRFARVPVFCATSQSRFFVLAELHGEDMRILGPSSMRGRPPICLPLPGLIFDVRPVDNYVCQGCRGPGTGAWFQCAGCSVSGDLLHSCPPGRCACHRQIGTRFCCCARLPVRGELVQASSRHRIGKPVPPGFSARVHPGGGG